MMNSDVFDYAESIYNKSNWVKGLLELMNDENNISEETINAIEGILFIIDSTIDDAEKLFKII